jgi:hypothetical protein
MGMDLVTAVLYHPKDTNLNFDAGRQACENLSIEDIDNYIENWVWDASPSADDFAKQAGERIKEAVDGVEAAITELHRNINMFTILGHTIIIAGCESWGDVDEIIDEFSILGCSDKVMKAIGFTVEELPVNL